MKDVLLGIKDYCKDCWHDFWYMFWTKMWTWAERRTFRCYDWQNNEGCYTKEGSVRHYIIQRKIGRKVKNERNYNKTR